MFTMSLVPDSAPCSPYAHFRLTDARTAWIAGIYADDDYVETPRVYALRRR